MHLSSPQRSVPLATQLVDQFRELIARGTWAVGKKVPSEHELARTLGISRNSVREAIRSLVHSGLLEARAGDGTYVVARSEMQVLLQRRIDADRIDEVYEVRSMLEQQAARLAALYADETQIEEMREALRSRDRHESTEHYVEHDVRFHRLILDSSQNALLIELHKNINDLAGHIENMVETAGPHSCEPDTQLNRKHHELLDAIASHDPERAMHLARAVIDLARENHRGRPRP